MSPTVPFDVILNFLIGAGVALGCAPQVKGVTHALWNRYLLGVFLFGAVLFVPFGAYLYYYHTDWSWMYFFDPGTLPPATLKWLGVFCLACYQGALVGGYLLAQWLVREGREKLMTALVAVVGAGLGVFSLFTLDRLLHIGSYAEFTTDQAVLLFKHRVGVLNTLVGTAMGLWLFFMIRSFRFREA